MSKQHRLTRVAALLAMFTLVVSLVGSPNTPYVTAADKQNTLTEGEKLEKVGVVNGEDKGETTPDQYIIQLLDAPVATYAGGVGQLKATSPMVTGERKVNLNSPAVRGYRTYLATKRAEALQAVRKITGDNSAPIFTYDMVLHGFVVVLTPEQAQTVAKLPHVKMVERRRDLVLHTDYGPQWINADNIWQGDGNRATTDVYAATLIGANEVPPVATTANGTAVAWFDTGTNMLTVRVQTSGVISPTAAHVHEGAAGATGGVVFGLTRTGTMWSGSGTLTAAQATALMQGELYVNVHNETFGGGVIRDQLRIGGKGEGIIVGIIDTGINFDHPSFAATGGDGYTHVNPFGPGNYKGACDSTRTPVSDSNPSGYNSTLQCNSKLIGAWTWPGTRGSASNDYNNNSPEDDDGHGSHTASTAAGNVVLGNKVINGITFGNISGVAPHANIIAYDGCCDTTALVASINQTVLDGVDVVNYSIGSTSPNDPWTDSDSVAFLNARAAGVIVANSAGNAGPGAGTIGSPADAPWLITVGATTHNRKLENGLINMTGGATPPPADMFGKSISGGFGPAPIVYAGAVLNVDNEMDPLCQKDYPAGSLTGKILVCERGVNGRVEKGERALTGGAAGMVLLNDAANGESVNADGHVLPAVHISYAKGVTLKAWLATGSGHMGTIRGTLLQVNDIHADIMAGFSSRGPNTENPGMIKPSVSAPGVDILAAYNTPDWENPGPNPEYGVISGTSMASPHTAGASALITMLNPRWTPAQVQSALMLTGVHDVRKENEVTPADAFDMGNGRIDVAKAAQAGFVMNITQAQYTAANPETGGKVEDLNLPSLANASCLDVCTWTRTISSTLPVATNWTVAGAFTGTATLTVSEPSFVLPAFGTKTLVITANVTPLTKDAWAFGFVNFTETGGLAPMASMAAAVKPVGAILPTGVDIEARRDAGSYLMTDIIAGEISNLKLSGYGFVARNESVVSLSQDTVRGDVYDDLDDGVEVIPVEITASDKRLVTEVFASEAPDVDLYVTFDANNDNIPQASEEVCVSGSATATELCEFLEPDAGTYHVLVQNWQGSGNQPDDISVGITVVPGTPSDNMEVSGPSSVQSQVAFDIRIAWNEPALTEGDIYYGVAGLGNGTPDTVGVFPVNLHRVQDDIEKTVSMLEIPSGSQQTLTYTIEIQPNLLPEDITYYLTDTLPSGMTIVPNSVTGGATANGNTITWNGVLPGTMSYPDDYVISTSVEDSTCRTPSVLTQNSGKYIDLGALGISLQTVSGDDSVFVLTTSGAPYTFYDTTTTALDISSNGFIEFSANGLSSSFPTNQPIGDPNDPNSLFAMFWDDLNVVRDLANGRGLRIANLNGTGPTGATIFQFDEVQLVSDPNARFDFELILYRSVSDLPGEYEAMVAFAGMTGATNSATIGVENEDATMGAQYLFNGVGGTIVPNNRVICFDYQPVLPDPIVITYQATVTAGAVGTTYTNTVQTTTTNVGSQLESHSAVVTVIEGDKVYLFLPFVRK